jgi:hypothetical protein
MSDLVKRLRELAMAEPRISDPKDTAMLAAADEIERLRDAYATQENRDISSREER